MGDGRELRWSLDLRSYFLGCLVPPVLLVAVWVWLSVEYGVAFLPVPTRSEGLSVVHSDLHQLGFAAGRFAEEHGDELPASFERLVTPDEDGNTYLRSLPSDPWRQPYLYERLGDHSARLACLGEDGLQGTDDDVVFVVERGPAWNVRRANDEELGRSRR